MICSDSDFVCKMKQQQGIAGQLANGQGVAASPVMPETTAQELTSLGGQGYEQQAAMDTMKQDATMQSSPVGQAPLEDKGFDFAGLGKALGALSSEEPYQHNMTLQYGGGKAPAPVQAEMPQQAAPSPMSQAMNAIKMTNMLYGAPQQQPQQQQQQPSLMRSLYGF
jgi:hypothetical protein